MWKGFGTMLLISLFVISCSHKEKRIELIPREKSRYQSRIQPKDMDRGNCTGSRCKASSIECSCRLETPCTCIEGSVNPKIVSHGLNSRHDDFLWDTKHTHQIKSHHSGAIFLLDKEDEVVSPVAKHFIHPCHERAYLSTLGYSSLDV